jgi:hypothetical protein
MTQHPSERVRVELTPDEALVLFAWTQRHEAEGWNGPAFVDEGERVAVQNLTAALEPLVDVVFSPDFARLLDAAKARLAG